MSVASYVTQGTDMPKAFAAHVAYDVSVSSLQALVLRAYMLRGFGW